MAVQPPPHSPVQKPKLDREALLRFGRWWEARKAAAAPLENASAKPPRKAA